MGKMMRDTTKYPIEYNELVEVILVSDDDGHDYLIHKELQEEFNRLSEIAFQYNTSQEGEEYDKWFRGGIEFDKLFSHLRIEGTQPSLYAKVGYEKEL